MTEDDQAQNKYPTDGRPLIEGELQEVEDGVATPIDMVGELEVIREALHECLDEIDGEEGKFTQRGSTILLEYFTLAHGAIELFSAYLLSENLTGGKIGSVPDFLLNDLSQYYREELLSISGEIDDGLKGELSTVRRIRNSLVHSPMMRHRVENKYDLKADVDRAYRSVTKLRDGMFDE